VILPDFILPSLANQRLDYSGMDTIERCEDRKHFNSYPYAIKYEYNSRGFRDAEWPDSIKELQQCIWCIGDSATVGIGNPINHTWPKILQERTGIRTIVVALEGGSNDWISRRSVTVLKEIKPQHLIIHWSFSHRREDSDTSLSDEDRRHRFIDASWNENTKNMLDCILNVESNSNATQVIHSFIPEFIDKSGKKLFNMTLDKNVKYSIPEFRKIDFARDAHHYANITATKFVNQIVDQLTI
jgi:hypothetical protein